MQQNIKNEIISWIKSIVFTLLIVVLFRQFLFVPIAVVGESMVPTLEDNNRIVVTKTTSIDRFDLIVFNAPNENEKYVKRVIGIPGDTVRLEDDVLFVNGEPFNETYINRKINGVELEKGTNDFSLEGIIGETVVPGGHLFVLGDNRFRSEDSRTFGLITEDSVVGEVKFRFFPLNQAGVVN